LLLVCEVSFLKRVARESSTFFYVLKALIHLQDSVLLCTFAVGDDRTPGRSFTGLFQRFFEKSWFKICIYHYYFVPLQTKNKTNTIYRVKLNK